MRFISLWDETHTTTRQRLQLHVTRDILTRDTSHVIMMGRAEECVPELIDQRNGPKKRRVVMALTRGMLKGMGLTEEQVGAIIDEHVSAIDGLKAERDRYKAEAEELPTVKGELEDLKKSIDSNDTTEWQDKYEKEHAEFEQYKTQVAEEKRESECRGLYKALLVKTGVGENHIDSILRVTDFSKIKINKDGGLSDESKLSEDIKSLYGGFITSQSAQGAGVENPPAGGNGMTKEAFSQLPLAEQMKYANEHPNEVNNLL